MFGIYYAFSTVVASIIMLNIGHALDYKSTRSITVFTTAGLAVSMVLWGLSINHVLLLVALVGLRLTGQGMMGHISVTVLSRYFIKEREKALSLAWDIQWGKLFSLLLLLSSSLARDGVFQLYSAAFYWYYFSFPSSRNSVLKNSMQAMKVKNMEVYGSYGVITVLPSRENYSGS